MRRLEIPVKLGLLVWALVITTARAARWPNDFAEAHWLLDYRFGLIKRGLAGSALTAVSQGGLADRSAATIAVLALLLFGLLCLTLVALAWRMLARHDWQDDAWVMTCVFMTSPAIVLNAHFMGYLDHVVVLGVAGATWLALRGRLWMAGAVAATGVLVHENCLALGVPLVAIAVLWPPRAGSPGRAAAARAAAVGLPLAAFAVLLLSDYFLDRGHLREQMVTYLSGFPFIERDINIYLPEWLTTSSVDGLRTMGHAFGSRLLVPGFVWTMGVPALLIVAWAVRQVPADDRARVAAAGLLVTLVPLLLHAVAWDTARIWAYPLLCAFAFAWWAGEAVPVQPPGTARRPWLLLLAVPVLATNLFARSPLMDGETERFSAATRLWLYSPLILALLAVLAHRLRAGFATRGGAAV